MRDGWTRSVQKGRVTGRGRKKAGAAAGMIKIREELTMVPVASICTISAVTLLGGRLKR